MFSCFITLLGVSFALALRKRMNYLMASCTNKTFIVIYIRQNPGEIKSSNSIWSWNFAELNRTCTVVTNIEIKPSEDVFSGAVPMELDCVCNKEPQYKLYY